MAHETRIVICSGPDDRLAFANIPLQPRRDALDAPCPVCRGRGMWNVEFDLVSQRAKRCLCDRCAGRGWIETGRDPLRSDDIVLGEDGHPRWVSRLGPLPGDGGG